MCKDRWEAPSESRMRTQFFRQSLPDLAPALYLIHFQVFLIRHMPSGWESQIPVDSKQCFKLKEKQTLIYSFFSSETKDTSFSKKAGEKLVQPWDLPWTFLWVLITSNYIKCRQLCVLIDGKSRQNIIHPNLR